MFSPTPFNNCMPIIWKVGLLCKNGGKNVSVQQRLTCMSLFPSRIIEIAIAFSYSLVWNLTISQRKNYSMQRSCFAWAYTQLSELKTSIILDIITFRWNYQAWMKITRTVNQRSLENSWNRHCYNYGPTSWSKLYNSQLWVHEGLRREQAELGNVVTLD